MQLKYRNLQQDYATAVNCRLSRDDGTDSESNSNQTQKQMLRRYSSEQGFQIYDEYAEAGYGGTTKTPEPLILLEFKCFYELFSFSENIENCHQKDLKSSIRIKAVI